MAPLRLQLPPLAALLATLTAVDALSPCTELACDGAPKHVSCVHDDATSRMIHTCFFSVGGPWSPSGHSRFVPLSRLMSCRSSEPH